MTPEDIEITKIKPEEQDETAAFCKSIYKEMGWSLRFKEDVDKLAEYFDNPGEIFLVVKKENQIIGCGGIKHLTKNNGLLKRFYIDRQFRGQGVAARLLEELVKFAGEQKYKCLVLDTRFDNLRAQKFYEKSGFLRFKTKPHAIWSESFAPKLFYYYRLKL